MTVQKDRSIPLQFTVTDNGEPFDVTGREVSVTFVNEEHRVTKDATVINAAAGLCEVQITEEETAEAGILYYQVHVSTNGGKRFSSPYDFITIRNEL